MSKPILIAAGGTGGHIFPALAVADDLRRRGVPVLWLGTRQGMEANLVPKAGYDLLTITISGIRRKGVLSTLVAPVRIARALWQSLALLRRVRPRAVLGMGGFVSGPAGMAAWLLGVPLITHEQNAVAGFTNSLLARFATRVLEAFPGTFRQAHVLCVGNPVRAEIAAVQAPDERFGQRGNRSTVRLMIFGGSQGAKVLNEIVPAALALITALEIEIWHQTGRSGVEATVAAYAGNGMDARIEPFISDMAEAYGWADLVICRAGALTIAELAAVGVGSVLVPYPAAVDDHQTVNARFLADAEAAVLLPQHELTPSRLAAILEDLLGSTERLLGMARSARALARAEATRLVADQLLELSHG